MIRFSGFGVIAASLAAAGLGCTATITTDGGASNPNFSESAATAIVPSPTGVGLGRSVLATLVISNASAGAQTLSWGADCGGSGPFELRAYRQVNGARVLAWSSAALPRLLGCPTVLVMRTLNPGDSAVITRTIDVASILGDSLPGGAYIFTVRAATTPAIPGEVEAGTLGLSSVTVSSSGANLDGRWSGAAQGVSLTLDLRWFADSVIGGGTFTVAGANGLGCGGGTLRGTGTVTFTAQRTSDQLSGAMTFSDGWVPPFGAVLVDTMTLGGAFGSVDGASCPPTLVRQ